MKIRHNLRKPSAKDLKRGLTITLALILCIFTIDFKKVKATSPQITVSSISFRDNTETNSSGSVIHETRFLVYSITLDNKYTGTFDILIRYNKLTGYAWDYLVEGASFQLTNRSQTANNGVVTVEDSFTFTLSDCNQINIIYVTNYSYLNQMGTSISNINLVASDGSSGNGAVDYTNYLTDIDASLDDALVYLDNLDATLEPLALNVNAIKNAVDTLSNEVDDIEELLTTISNNIINYNTIYALPTYTHGFYWLLRNTGYSFENVTMNTLYSWRMKAPASYTTKSRVIYFTKDATYSMMFYSNTISDTSITFHQYGYAEDTRNYTFTIPRYGFNYTSAFKYIEFTWTGASAWYWIKEATNFQYLVPIYFGYANGMPGELQDLLHRDSTWNLIKKIYEALLDNNAQNEEVIDKLDDISQDTNTISQQIDTLNTDFNNAMQSIDPAGTISQLNEMQSQFSAVNGWIGDFYDALGKFKIVIIISLMLALIGVFIGRWKSG